MSRLAIFDVDGTLIDSQKVIVAAMQMAFAGHGLAEPDLTHVRRNIGLELIEAVARLLPDSEAALHATLAAAYKEAFFSLHNQPEHEAPMFEGVGAALDQLEAQGWLLAVATGKSGRGMERVLDRYDLRSRFVSVQTADGNPGKPNPSMVLRVLAESGCDAQYAVMIGDTSYDMAMGVNAGVHRLGVGWGYHPAEELIAAGGEAIVRLPSELPAALNQLVAAVPEKAIAGLAG